MPCPTDSSFIGYGRYAFPTPGRFDEALASMNYRRSGDWRRCAGGDEWEADVVSASR